MNKAKLALSAIAIFAVIGGAFAFKAARDTNDFYSSNPVNGNCSVTFPTTLTTNLIGTGATFITTLSPVQLLSQPCPTIKVRVTG
jgi:hypothetical protein